MRKLLITTALMAATSGAAFAADLPSRTAPVYAPPPVPVFTWSGGYFGINAGYAFDYGSRFTPFQNTALEAGGGVGINRPGTRTVTSDGFTAGGQIGYNYQFGAGSGIVVGVEADAAYTDLDQTNNYLVGGSVSRLHSDMDFLGTVRGRVGYAFDRFLVYGTGGFAYGDVDNRARFFGPAPIAGITTFTGQRSDFQTGYTYGGGLEYAMPTDSFLNFFHSSAVTVKAEYLHYNLGTETLAVNATGAGGSSGSYSERVHTNGDLARIGINYKF